MDYRCQRCKPKLIQQQQFGVEVSLSEDYEDKDNYGSGYGNNYGNYYQKNSSGTQGFSNQKH